MTVEKGEAAGFQSAAEFQFCESALSSVVSSASDGTAPYDHQLSVTAAVFLPPDS